MTLTILLSIMFGLIIASNFATTPVNLGIWILFISLMISMLISLTISTWFGALLFLIYIGGMLVMFTYFAAVSPNLELQLKLMFFMAVSFSTISYLYFFMFSSPMIPSLNMTMNPLMVSPLYESMNTPLLILLGALLFLALILVVKVSQRMVGPLRPFFN